MSGAGQCRHVLPRMRQIQDSFTDQETQQSQGLAQCHRTEAKLQWSDPDPDAQALSCRPLPPRLRLLQLNKIGEPLVFPTQKRGLQAIGSWKYQGVSLESEASSPTRQGWVTPPQPKAPRQLASVKAAKGDCAGSLPAQATE